MLRLNWSHVSNKSPRRQQPEGENMYPWKCFTEGLGHPKLGYPKNKFEITKLRPIHNKTVQNIIIIQLLRYQIQAMGNGFW